MELNLTESRRCSDTSCNCAMALGLTRTLCITEKVGRTIDDLVELLER